MQTIIVPCLFDNFSYIIQDDDSHAAIIVDPSEGWPVLKVLAANRLRPVAILCTHHHADHLGGIADLLREYRGLAVYGSAREQKISSLTHRFSPGAPLLLGGIPVRTIATPGHTLASVVYQVADMMFTGDTLFGAGCGRLFEGSAAQLHNALATINREQPHTKIYAGHEYTLTNLRFAAAIEPENQDISIRQKQVQKQRERGQSSMPSELITERLTNPFLRCREPALINHLRDTHGLKDQSECGVFTLLRALRNDFS